MLVQYRALSKKSIRKIRVDICICIYEPPPFTNKKNNLIKK